MIDIFMNHKYPSIVLWKKISKHYIPIFLALIPKYLQNYIKGIKKPKNKYKQ